MNSRLPRHDIVLIGAGHTNAHVLRMWRMSPLADTRLTCITDSFIAAYSGMLPGTLAGLYTEDRMQIDLVRLCAASGARLIRGEVTGLDLPNQRVFLRDRPPVPFDALSIGIGSVPKLPPSGTSQAEMVTIKPMQTFLARLGDRLTRLDGSGDRRPWQIAVVGAGAGGVEVTFCLSAYLARNYPGRHYDLALIDSGQEILPGAGAGMIRRARRELAARDVRLMLGREVGDIRQRQLLIDGDALPVDLAIWATSGVAPPLLGRLGLPTDEKGFLLTRANLRTVADVPVFVVGDSGTSVDHPTPKAGVFAVRQGPVLWENLRRQLNGDPLNPYVPQRNFMKLLATGDRRAILEYKGMSFHAAWCWKLKDAIDSRFMRKLQDYRPSMMAAPAVDPTVAMQCAGCGGKLAGSVLSRALARLDVPPAEHVLLGLDRPDDAAIVRLPGGGPVAATVDFFAPFIDDPYLVGRVAAINAFNDLVALGCQPAAALALAAVEPGPERQQEQYLYELLAGGLREFHAVGASLVGGHTIESPKPLVGFSVIATASERPQLKSGLRAGDLLVLTKPLGTGILLAAQMRAECRAEWFEALLRVLVAGNQHAAQSVEQFDISGMTDVTGFGLAGHLLEMLRAGEVSAELWLDRIPLLPGVGQLSAGGIESSLAPANRSVATEIEVDDQTAATTEYPVLFDPQTSGGLLLGVVEHQAENLVSRLAEQSNGACVIGRIVAGADHRKLRILRSSP
jgi:selenide,water dikinase